VQGLCANINKKMEPIIPLLSVIVIFYNMRREALRTLHSLTLAYQNIDVHFEFEIIVIDNNSSEPLDKATVTSFGSNFQYHYYETSSPSPVGAVNFGASLAKGKMLAINIDGARILSPGIFSAINHLANSYSAPFIYTLVMHLGPKVQNVSISEGYSQEVEDKMLNEVEWENDGYRLFEVASLAGSSVNGFEGPIAESNCYCLPRLIFLEMGGLNPLFQTPGGGLVNLDFYDKAMHTEALTPIFLLGEATFHQIHGGVATNVALEDHPMDSYQKEYRRIYNKLWRPSTIVDPVRYGTLTGAALKFATAAS